MKKFILFLLFGLILFIPCSVNAEAAKYGTVLTCPASADLKDDGTFSFECSFGVNVTSGSLSKLEYHFAVTGGATITPDSYLKEDTFTGTINSLDKVTVTGSGSGEYTVKISTYYGKDADGVTDADPIGIAGSQTVSILNTNTKLRTLTVDGVLLAGFDPNTKSYNVQANKGSVIIGATGQDDVTVIAGIGEKTLSCGNNSAIVKTRAEKSEITDTYTIAINRVCSADSSLKNIKPSSGSLSPSFSSDRTSYKVEVEANVSSITFTNTKNTDTQTVEQTVTKSLNYGDNNVSFDVTAEDGSKKTYSITVTRKDDRSKENTLSSITLSDGKIPFDKDVLEYKFKVLYNVSSITVTPKLTDDKAKVEVTGGDALVVGENTISIKVTAENGDEKTYTILVTRLAEGEDMGNNPAASNITVDGYTLNFKSNTFNYNLKIKDEKELLISVDLEEKSAEYSIRGNSDLKDGSIITIVTTSEDGTSLTYKINISKDSNMLIWIILGALLLIILIVIVILVLKKKGKNDDTSDVEDSKVMKKSVGHTTEQTVNVVEKKEVKTNVVSDKELLDKVNKQIKKTEVLSNEELLGLGETKNKIDPISPISILAKKPVNNSVESLNREAEKQFSPTRGERYAETDKDLSLRSNSGTVNRAEAVSTQGDGASATKICSICGHRVPATAKVCPYCRRIWN